MAQNVQGHGEVKEAKCELLNQIICLVDEGDEVWGRLVSEQQACTNVIAQQVAVNDKFSEYHDLWLERSVPDDIMTFHRFNEIDEEVTALANLLENFESRSLKAMDTIKELCETFSANRKHIDQVRKDVLKSTDLSQLNAIYLDDFQWIDSELIPNVLDLEDEWAEMNLYQRINSLVGQMHELSNGPDNPGEYYSSDGSSSSATEALGAVHNSMHS